MVRDPFQMKYVEGKSIRKDSSELTENWEEALIEGQGEEQEVRTISPLFDYKKIKWFYLVIVLVFFLLIIRLFYFQVLTSDTFKQAAAENRFRIQTKKSIRGVVYDTNKNILVRNVPSFDLVVIPADLPKEESAKELMLSEVESYLEMTEGELSEVLEGVGLSSYNPLVAKSNIDRDKALFIQPRLADLPGVNLEVNARRYYEDALAFAHVLGYVGKITSEELKSQTDQGDYQPTDWLGKSGLEYFYETELRGQNGQEQVEVDSKGKVKEVVAVSQPVTGQDIILTIDKDFQDEVGQILSRNLQSKTTNRAVAVVLDPRSGAILAVVSLPQYDNNLFTEGISTEDYNRLINNKDRPLFNRVISGVYPPGSTVKPMVAAAALEEGVITANTTINDTGSISVPNKYNPDIVYNFVGWNLAGLGPMNLYSAIAKSSDIYFYVVGGGFEDREGLGVNKLGEYYKKFGLGARTGIDLPNEKEGLIPTPEWKEEYKGEEWYLGDTYHMAIGQGDVLVNPLQVASWTATIANGGTVYKPFLVRKMIDSEGNTKEILPRSTNESFISQNNIELVQRAMRETVLSGSGKSLGSLPFSSAGKTGTAQHSGSGDNHAWYTAFAPYEDPEVVVTVLVEEGGEGGEVAVPIAGEILRWYFDH